jgi:PKD repeat protein
LLGSQVTFTDLSTNFPSEWKWTFEGADPNSSTEKNPRVTYNSAGTFDVTLIVKNELGSDTLTLQDFVTVTEEGLCRSFNNFLPEYTPSVLNMKDFANYTGYLTGTNTARNQAYSEYFSNNCGYKYVSGVAIRFGALTVVNEETTINVTVWNARGRQNSPGAVIERKAVLAKQILQDIANNRPTIVTFDRETPVFSRPFHVGFEIDYQQGYQVAVTSSANGEATNATSWLKKADGEWELFTIEYGANIAMDIAPAVGMNPSVQVSASKLLVSPGEQVTLAGRGASIFIWSSTDGTVQQVAAPQINVNPLQTTTYTTAGSGLDLCNASASTTIYVREGVVGTELQQELSGLTIAPNPGSAQLTVTLDHQSTGEVEIMMESMLGQRVLPSINAQKTQPVFQQTIETSSLRAGLYLVRVYFNKESRVVKWVKQ